MKNIFIAGLIFIFLTVSIAVAQEISIKAEVDRTVITTDETLTYKLVITSSEKKIPSPVVPKFEGFNILYQAQSSTVSLVESRIKTVIVYAFILAPANVGKFKIGPSAINIKNKTYSTETFEIEVRQGEAKPKVVPEQKPALPPENQPESEQPKITL